MTKKKATSKGAVKKAAMKAYQQGRKDIRQEILVAIQLQFNRASGFDPCDSTSPCEMCKTWHEATVTVKGVKP